MRQLRHLTLDNVRFFNEPALNTPPPEMPHLTTLIVQDCPFIPSHIIVNLIEKCNSLSTFSIAGCSIGEEELVPIIRRNTEMQRIYIGAKETASIAKTGSAVGDELAHAMANTCKNVKTLEITGAMPITDDGFTHLMQKIGPRLDQLHVGRAMQVQQSALAHIDLCQNLSQLSLYKLPNVSDALLGRVLSEIGDKIVFLSLDSLPIGNAGIRHVTRRNLTELHLIDLELWSDFSILLASGGLQQMSRLRVSECTSVSLAGLAHTTSPLRMHYWSSITVEYLEISGCPAMTEVDLATCAQWMQRR